LLLALYLLSFGLCWTLISYLLDFVFNRMIIPDTDKRLKLNFLLWILKVVILVHVIYFIREVLCDWQCIDLAEYAQLYVACLVFFVLTYVPFSLYAKFKYFQSIVVTDSHGENQFELKGEGKKTERINLASVLYITADDNYVDLTFISPENQVKKMAVRATIHSMETQLKEHPQFVRVHRKYIINLRHVSKIAGNKSIQIKSGDSEIEIPVSKKYENQVLALQVD